MSKYTQFAERMTRLEERADRQENQIELLFEQNKMLREYLGVCIASKPLFQTILGPVVMERVIEERGVSKIGAIMEFLEAEFHTEPACDEKLTVRVKKNGK
jgi:hypothetical protein